MTTKASRKNNWGTLSEAILISGFTLLGYFYAYIFEASFLYHFKIPFEFIQIGVSRTIWITIILIFFFLYILFLTLFVRNFSKDKKSGKASLKFWPLLLAMSFGYFLPITIFLIPLNRWYVAVILYFILAVETKFIFWMLQKIGAFSGTVEDFFRALKEKWGKLGLIIAVLCIMNAFVVMSLGNLSAQTKVVFPVIKIRSEDFVIIRIYEGGAISMPLLNREKKLLSNEVRLLDPAVIKSQNLKLEAIGPLRLDQSNFTPRTIWDYLDQFHSSFTGADLFSF